MERKEHIFKKVGWIRGPMQSVAYCTICNPSRPFVVVVTKTDRRAQGGAMAAAQTAKAKVAKHIRENHGP